MSDDFAKFLTLMGGIVTIAIIAVIVGKNSQSGKLAQTFFSGFATDIQAAVSPVTGGGGLQGGSGLSLNLGIG